MPFSRPMAIITILAVLFFLGMTGCQLEKERQVGQMVDGDLVNRAAFYDAIYAKNHGAAVNVPSPFLMEILASLPLSTEKRTALDIGSGNGRNSVYAAEMGYLVHAVDLSAEGIEQTRQKASLKDLSIHTHQESIRTFDLGFERYDLILLIDFPFASDDLWAKIKRGLKPGGIVIVKAVTTLQPHQDDETLDYVFLDYGRLKKAFKGFRVIKDTEGPAGTLWGGRKIMARYAAQKPSGM